MNITDDDTTAGISSLKIGPQRVVLIESLKMFGFLDHWKAVDTHYMQFSSISSCAIDFLILFYRWKRGHGHRTRSSRQKVYFATAEWLPVNLSEWPQSILQVRQLCFFSVCVSVRILWCSDVLHWLLLIKKCMSTHFLELRCVMKGEEAELSMQFVLIKLIFLSQISRKL